MLLAYIGSLIDLYGWGMMASVVSENSSLSRTSAVRFLKVSGKGLPLL